MALWSARPVLYKLGCFGLFSGFVIFVVGFSTPYWLLHTDFSRGAHLGLWEYCSDRCLSLEVREDWFEAVRALECLAVIIYFGACVVAMYDNCLADFDPCTYAPSRRVEAVTCLAGMTGAAGLVIYSVMMDVNRSADYVLGWSHTLTSAGLSVAFLVVIVMAITNKASLPGLQAEAADRETEQTIVMSYQFTDSSASPLHQPAVLYMERADHKCQLSETSAFCVSPERQIPAPIAQPFAVDKKPAKNGWKPKSNCYQT